VREKFDADARADLATRFLPVLQTGPFFKQYMHEEPIPKYFTSAIKDGWNGWKRSQKVELLAVIEK
jgi:hypothetical protein